MMAALVSGKRLRAERCRRSEATLIASIRSRLALMAEECSRLPTTVRHGFTKRRLDARSRFLPVMKAEYSARALAATAVACSLHPPTAPLVFGMPEPAI